ncbi:MAG TPA: HIT family protein [Planctomycetota bacterium]|nr:HIT family protein [Planctomycetota bacterium]
MSHPDLLDIVTGRRFVHVIRRDALHLAYLAERPVRKGHVIVATKARVDGVFDLSAEAHAALWAFVRETAIVLRERLPCERVCVSVIGWVVRHAHVHLVPTDAPGQVPGLEGPPLPPEEMAAIAARLG